MVSRPFSLIGAVVLAAMLAACTLGDSTPASADSEPAFAEDEPTPEERAQAACYVQSLDDQSWSRAYEQREGLCFRNDSCFGGLGQVSSEGRPLCYKWAMAPDAPPLRWSRALTHPHIIGADIPPPEPVYEGSFEQTNDCFNEACTPPPTQFAVETPLYVDADASSRRVGVVPPGECVQPGGYRLRAAPRRGVVLEATDQFEAGEVIYQLAYQGEGYVAVWQRGEVTDVYLDDVVARWDPAPAPPDPREGNWLQLTRADGSAGWARDAQRSEASCPS